MSEVIDGNIKHLCADFLLLKDVDICSFMDFANNYSKFEATLAQALRDISTNNSCVEMNRKIGTKESDAVSLLVRVTRSSAIFQFNPQISRRAKLREIPIRTF